MNDDGVPRSSRFKAVAAVDCNTALDIGDRELGRLLEREWRRSDRDRIRHHRAQRRENLRRISQLNLESAKGDVRFRTKYPPTSEVERVVHTRASYRAVYATSLADDIAVGIRKLESRNKDAGKINQGIEITFQHALQVGYRGAAVNPVRQRKRERTKAPRDRIVNRHGRILNLVGWRLIGECRGIENQRRWITAKVNGVITGTPANHDLEGRAAAQDVDSIIAAAGVDFEPFDVGEIGDAAGAHHIFIGHNERVGKARAVDDHGVIATSAVDLHRRVLQVGISITTAAAE